MATSDEIDELARRIVRTEQRWQQELEERRTPPPRSGKYKDDDELSGAVPVSDLRDTYE